MSNFVTEFNRTMQQVHQMARAKGFWDGERSDAATTMLVVTELAECVEGVRHGNPPSDHIPEFSAAEEEYADAIIRMMDHACGRGWRLAEAIEAKMAFNEGRPHMHGKQF